MLSLALSLLFIFFSSLVSADLDSYPVLNDWKLLHEWASLTVTTGVIGVILIFLGILLTFSGKRFFKLFTGASGFLALGLATAVILYEIDTWFSFGPYRKWVVYGGAVVMGLAGASICLTMWKLGVYAMAGLGGYFLGTWLMTLKVGGVISNELGRDVFLAICIAACSIAVIFFEGLVIVASSAIVGGNALVIGTDCFLDWGYNVVLLSMWMTSEIIIPSYDAYLYAEIAAVLGLAVVGMVVQWVSGAKSGKEGFGRAD